MGGSIKPSLKTALPEEGCHEGASGPFAVRTGHMDNFEGKLRMAQFGQKRLHGLEPKPPAQPFQRFQPQRGSHRYLTFKSEKEVIKRVYGVGSNPNDLGLPWRLRVGLGIQSAQEHKNFRYFPRIFFISLRGTMASTNPWSTRNSERWKPLGSFCRMVCSMTRGPAKPTMAPGSARFTSPNMLKEAATPPVVGSVKTEMKGRHASPRRAKAAEVLAICIRENIPSCMRAPPEVETMIIPISFSRALSTARVIFSPTTLPKEPPMNWKSMMATEAGSPLILPMPVMTASFILAFSWPLFNFSSYSGKPRGFLETSFSSNSSKDPESTVR